MIVVECRAQAITQGQNLFLLARIAALFNTTVLKGTGYYKCRTKVVGFAHARLTLLKGLHTMGNSGFWLFLLVVYSGILVCMAIRRVDENKCLVTFQFGKVLRVSGPGFAFVWPILQTCKIVDKSTQSRPLPEVKLTGCSECSAVSGTFEFQIFDPLKCLAIVNLENSIEQTVHTTLLSVMSKATIGQCLTERSILESTAQDLINRTTREWGVEVSQLTFSRFPLQLQVVKQLSGILSQQILSPPLLIEEVAKQDRIEPVQSFEDTVVTLEPHVQYKFGIDE